jgi:hypothetical protein
VPSHIDRLSSLLFLNNQLKVFNRGLANGPKRIFGSVKEISIGVATTNVPKFNYTSSKFSKTLVLVGPSMVSSSISLHCPLTLT